MLREHEIEFVDDGGIEWVGRWMCHEVAPIFVTSRL